MLLKKIIKNISEKKNLRITGLSTNSQEVKRGNIFFAIKGSKNDGEKFIKEAIIKGAAVIVCSNNCKYSDKEVLFLKKNNVRSFLSEVSSKYYRHKPKNIIAITGTNGKTSVADLFYQILSLNNSSVASIGTFGVKFKNKIIKTKLTSPDTISIHKYLQILKKKNIENVIIEASSHGLSQYRLHNINFKAGIFTNFSRDHLDYHKSMTAYLSAKLILFKKILKINSSVILDKEITQFSRLKKISNNKKIKIIEISKTQDKIKNFPTVLTSEFKKKNLAMAIEAAKLCDVKEKKIFESLKRIKEVNGRLELVKIFPNNVKVFVDYAHTPDALQKVLKSLDKDWGSNISLVFGCGGDRDKKKRIFMAKIAKKYSKKIYVTDDNPRNESPSKIRNEIVKGIKPSKCFNISNRKNAIKKAILNSKQNDVILIAGKGHEENQIYKNKVLKISDKQIIKNLNIKVKPVNKKKLIFSENKYLLKKIIGNRKIKDFEGLAIDSRLVKKNNLFLTIKGKKNDGAKFVDQAFKHGAKYVVSSKFFKKNKKKTIRVN